MAAMTRNYVDGIIIPLTAYHNVVNRIINLLTALKISVNSIVGNAVDSIKNPVSSIINPVSSIKDICQQHTDTR